MSSASTLPAVPKRIFLFWGKQKMSWMRYMTLFSLRKLNPEWKIQLYVYDSSRKDKYWKGEEIQDFFNYKGDDYFDQIEALNIQVLNWKPIKENTGPSHESNFFKWYQLATEGGIYSDMDILWLKPIDEFYNQIKTYDVSICCFGNSLHIGLLAATPNNEFFRKILQGVKQVFKLDQYQGAGVGALYRMFKRTYNQPDLFRRVREFVPNLGYFDIPKNLIYPFRWCEMNKVFNERHGVPEETIGIHWYAGTHIAQEWNNKLTINNYEDYCEKSTFCNFVKML